MNLTDFNDLHVFDMEFDSLVPTRIHVFSCTKIVDNQVVIVSTNDQESIAKFFTSERKKTIVGHNIIQYDIPAVERILGIKVNENIDVVDTLGLSWYLYPERDRHSLGFLAKDFLGEKKVDITDWESLTYEEYKARCEKDVDINYRLYINMINDFVEIYDNIEHTIPTIERIMFKIRCLKLQADSKWKIDIERTTKNRDELVKIKDDLTMELQKLMPAVPIVKKRLKPQIFYRADNTVSVAGYNFLNLYFKGKIPPDELHRFTGKIHTDDSIAQVEYIEGYVEPNASSTDQIKDWLKSMGWKPDKFNFSINKNGEKTFVESILTKDKVLSDSVKKLAVKIPELYNIEKIGILTNRIGTLNNFLKNQKDGYLIAGASSLTNTLRLKHKNIVNLPKPKVAYGSYIRGCLIAEDGYELVEADMSSLENTTRNHFIYDLDRRYVESLSDPSFDSHIDLALTAKLMTEAEAEFFKWYKKKDEKI